MHEDHIGSFWEPALSVVFTVMIVSLLGATHQGDVQHEMQKTNWPRSLVTCIFFRSKCAHVAYLSKRALPMGGGARRMLQHGWRPRERAMHCGRRKVEKKKSVDLGEGR